MSYQRQSLTTTKLTPSKIIYNAWLNTEKPIAYEIIGTKGNLNHKDIDFADPRLNKYYDAEYDGQCNLCGEHIKGGIPVNKMFSSNYMDWPIHKSQMATHVCEACAFCIGMNPAGRVALFRYPIVAEKVLHLCNRKQLKDFILEPPEPPFVMILPTSQKKHLFSKSKVSYSRDKYFCNLEEMPVPINGDIVRIVKTIEALRGIGFRKSDIESLKIPWTVMKSIGMKESERMIVTMSDIKNSEMFALALEVSQKMNEEEARCCLDLKQKMR